MRIDDDLSYGYHWYSGDTWKGGSGNGGQVIYVAPALDLVVAITGGRYGTRDRSMISIVLEEVILEGIRS